MPASLGGRRSVTFRRPGSKLRAIHNTLIFKRFFPSGARKMYTARQGGHFWSPEGRADRAVHEPASGPNGARAGSVPCREGRPGASGVVRCGAPEGPPRAWAMIPEGRTARGGRPPWPGPIHRGGRSRVARGEPPGAARIAHGRSGARRRRVGRLYTDRMEGGSGPGGASGTGRGPRVRWDHPRPGPGAGVSDSRTRPPGPRQCGRRRGPGRTARRRNAGPGRRAPARSPGCR